MRAEMSPCDSIFRWWALLPLLLLRLLLLWLICTLLLLLLIGVDAAAACMLAADCVFNCLKIFQLVMCNQLTTTGARCMKYSTGHPGCRTDSCTVSKPCLAYRFLLPGDVASTQLHLPCLSATLVACTCQQDDLLECSSEYLLYPELTYQKNRKFKSHRAERLVLYYSAF